MVENSKKISVTFNVNGKELSVETYPMTSLLQVLRENLRLTGTKEGCGEGECGACTVLMNGEIVTSCLVPILQVQGAQIRTIEGIAKSGTLSKIQDAFLKYGGAQCGICTPGMVISATKLLETTPNPTLDQIKEGLAGNLCRCTGYIKIFESVLEACSEGEVKS